MVVLGIINVRVEEYSTYLYLHCILPNFIKYLCIKYLRPRQEIYTLNFDLYICIRCVSNLIRTTYIGARNNQNSIPSSLRNLIYHALVHVRLCFTFHKVHRFGNRAPKYSLHSIRPDHLTENGSSEELRLKRNTLRSNNQTSYILSCL